MDEADSPRGRIVLMEALVSGQLESDGPAMFHLDRCLGCRACETACPSGVDYGAALEKVRARKGERSLKTRTALRVFGSRTLLSALGGMARVARRAIPSSSAGVSRSVNTLLASLPQVEPGPDPASVPSLRPDRGMVQVFTGCVMDALQNHIHESLERVLRLNGFQPVRTPEQVCCGALHAHSGDVNNAARLRTANRDAFENTVGPVVLDSAGCGAALRDYGKHDATCEAFSGRVFDWSELLTEPVPGSPDWAPVIVYDPPCHLVHAQHVRDQPVSSMRAALPSAHVRVSPDPDLCCGGAGMYTLEQPDLSAEIGENRVNAILELAPDIIVTGNPGCILQLRAILLRKKSAIPVLHPLEVMDQAYRLAGHYGVSG